MILHLYLSRLKGTLSVCILCGWILADSGEDVGGEDPSLLWGFACYMNGCDPFKELHSMIMAKWPGSVRIFAMYNNIL